MNPKNSSQSVSASASDGGTDQQTAGYGTNADIVLSTDTGSSGDVSSSAGNCSLVHAWASVSAKSPTKDKKGNITKHTSASAWTTCNVQNYWYLYSGSGSYEYPQTADTWNYSGTVSYDYRYWVPNNIPVVGLSNNAPDPLYRNTPVQFCGTAYDTDGTIVSTQWGGIISGTGVGCKTWTPTTLGDFTANFTATDNEGDSNTASNTVKVINRLPTVTAKNNASSPQYRFKPVTFTGTANDLDGSIVATNWTGDVTGAGYSKAFTPTELGNYSATITVTDNDGGKASATTSFSVVNQKPEVEIISPKGTHSNPGIIPGTSGALKWDFTDGDGDPQTSYRVRVYKDDGTIFKDSGQVYSAASSYNIAGLTPGGLYNWTVTVTDPYDTVASAVSWFRAGENFSVNEVIPRQPVEEVSKNVSMFIAGKYGPDDFPVDVKVQKTLGAGANTVAIKLTRTAYGKTWTETKNISVGTSEQTVTFTVPNVETQDIRNWQKANNKSNTSYDSFKFTATLTYTGVEIDYSDNTKTAQFRSAEFGRSQLTR
ncbi:hypothetical protein ACFSR7_05800 [Cohnella sp. GCM10020058]|uniref:glycoside hydrolase family 78 protein n=1 Tax=Cohnella sp. GCM10020058 TaxID=3317330 RepID=UPI00362FB546